MEHNTSINHENGNDANRLLAVRCINNKGFKKDLKIGKIYQARQSKHFSDSWEFDLDGGIITYKKKRFEVVQQ